VTMPACSEAVVGTKVTWSIGPRRRRRGATHSPHVVRVGRHRPPASTLRTITHQAPQGRRCPASGRLPPGMTPIRDQALVAQPARTGAASYRRTTGRRCEGTFAATLRSGRRVSVPWPDRCEPVVARDGQPGIRPLGDPDRYARDPGRVQVKVGAAASHPVRNLPMARGLPLSMISG